METTVDPSYAQAAEPSEPPARAGWHAFAVVLACATFLLVIAGGLVTSTGSALSVPDWPLAFGKVFPRMVGGVLFEHGHRLIAGAVGFLTVILAAGLWKTRAGRVVRILSLCAVGAVILQGLLGGLTVLLRLPLPVSVAHACLGQGFFCIMVCLALLSRPSAAIRRLGRSEEDSELKKLRRLAYMTSGFIFLQLILGAILRHSGQGLDLHLTVAALVGIHVLLLAKRILWSPLLAETLRKPAMILLALVGLQILLGIHAWWLPSVAITTAHVANGALVLATSVVISVYAYLGWVPA